MLFRRSRDVVGVRGPDAETYLQGQLSQDVVALADDTSAWSFLLQPTGRVDAWLRITRRGEGDYLLDVDGGFGGAVQERLGRFLLRTDCVIEPLDWDVTTVLGTEEAVAPAGGMVVVLDFAGFTAVDLLGPGRLTPRAHGWGRNMGGRTDQGRDAGNGKRDRREHHSERHRTGRAFGELHQGLLHGAGTRCPDRQPHRRSADAPGPGSPAPGAAPPAGADLRVEGDVVGTITSVVGTDNGFMALGYRKRSVLEVTAAEAHWEGGRESVVLQAA